jgi:hypothetical protein
MRVFNVLTSVSLLCLWTSSSLAQVYKWVDEHGVTHYSQTKPADEAEEIKVKGMKSAKDRETYGDTGAVAYSGGVSSSEVDCDRAVRHSTKLMVDELKASSSGNNNPFADVLTDPTFIIETIAACNREIQDPAKAAVWLCQQNASTAKQVELCERNG